MVYLEGIENLFIFQGVMLIIFLIIALIFLVILIATLIHQAKRGRWGWFTITLILSLLFGLGFLMVLIYWSIWLIVPEFRRKKS